MRDLFKIVQYGTLSIFNFCIDCYMYHNAKYNDKWLNTAIKLCKEKPAKTRTNAYKYTCNIVL